MLYFIRALYHCVQYFLNRLPGLCDIVRSYFNKIMQPVSKQHNCFDIVRKVRSRMISVF